MTVFEAYSKEDVIEELKHSAVNAYISTEANILAEHKNDPNGVGDADGDLLAYVEVTSKDDIKGVLKVARKYHIPVIPQTTATSTVSGSDAEAGGIMLSMVRMNHILEIDQEDSLAVVEPGVINNDLNEAAKKVGMFYAPDPGSRPISAIGGNASTNAGGMSTIKYGATRDSVLGLTVILADGRELKLGGRTYKQAFGYDLTHLFVGSEGTLGIITEITVKLFPVPLGQAVMGLAFFNSMTVLSNAVTEIRASGVYPAMLEALDARTVDALDQYEGTHYAENNEAMLIFKLDVGGEDALKVVEKILVKFNANNITLTSDEEKMAEITKLRQDMLPAVFKGQNHVMEDMAVPLSKLAPMMDYIQEVATKLDVPVFTAGHAGDGNVHPTLTWPLEEKEVPEKVVEALGLMFKKTLELGGTISGEHAVGMLKNQWVNTELGDDVDMLQHQIKSLLDPMNILNPKRKIN